MNDNLSYARSRRSLRAAKLDELRNGQLALRELLKAPPAALASCDLWDVLLACPHLGRAGARVVCERAHVWPHTPMDRLMKRELRAIDRVLPRRVK